MKVLPIKSINSKHITDIHVKSVKTSNITDYSNQNAKSDLSLNGSTLLIYFGSTSKTKNTLDDFKIRELTDEEYKAKKEAKKKEQKSYQSSFETFKENGPRPGQGHKVE